MVDRVVGGAAGVDEEKLPGPPSDSGTDGTPSEEASSDEEYWREILVTLRKKAVSKKKADLVVEPAPESPPTIVAPAPVSPVEGPGPVAGPPVEGPGPVAVLAASGSHDAAALPASGSHDPAALPRAAPRNNDVLLRGRLVKLLFNNSTGERAWSGYSWQCLACEVWKDLHFVRSGMHPDEALDRLQVWESRCRPNHKLYGGKLLILCAS